MMDGLMLIGPVVNISEAEQPSWAWTLIHGHRDADARIDVVMASDEQLAALLRQIAADALVKVCQVEVFDRVQDQVEQALDLWPDAALFRVPGEPS
jgi:hypothetical protein